MIKCGINQGQYFILKALCGNRKLEHSFKELNSYPKGKKTSYFFQGYFDILYSDPNPNEENVLRYMYIYIPG